MDFRLATVCACLLCGCPAPEDGADSGADDAACVFPLEDWCDPSVGEPYAELCESRSLDAALGLGGYLTHRRCLDPAGTWADAVTLGYRTTWYFDGGGALVSVGIDSDTQICYAPEAYTAYLEPSTAYLMSFQRIFGVFPQCGSECTVGGDCP